MEYGVKRPGSGEASGIDGWSQSGLRVCGPFCAIAIGHLALDDTGPQRAFGDVVGGIDLTCETAEGEHLVAGAADLAEQVASERTMGVAGKDGVEIAHQRALPALHGRGGECGDVPGKAEGAVEPELEAHVDQVAAMLGDVAGLAVQVRQACLMKPAMSLLGAIAVRYPDLGLMPVHRIAYDLGRPAESGRVENGMR